MNPAFHTQRRVEFRDTDAAGLVHFSAFFFWMESTEHEFWRSVGVELVEPVEGGGTISWPRVSATCDFVEAVRFGEVLDVRMHVAHVGRTSVSFGFRFEHAGRAVADGKMVAVRCRLLPGLPPQPVAIPEPLSKKLAEFVV